ncbi:MAG: DUF1499 domain-containing protein [Psychromonas sp.]
MRNRSSRLGSVLLVAAIVAVFAIGVMISGARLGLWEPIVGFGLIRTYMNPIAYTLSGVGAFGLVVQLVTRNRAGMVKTGITTLLGLGLLTPMIYEQTQPAASYPPIHDITTDTSNPPAFRVLDDNRAGAKNSLLYGGPEITAQQNDAYPDIAPILSNKSASKAFSEALRVGKSMGWEIVAQDPEQLRFEATARTPVYRFVDDIVVVVSSAADGESRIDIRSVSRIGRGDRGVNATRIREFITAFQR